MHSMKRTRRTRILKLTPTWEDVVFTVALKAAKVPIKAIGGTPAIEVAMAPSALSVSSVVNSFSRMIRVNSV
jgi:hypothetical protein